MFGEVNKERGFFYRKDRDFLYKRHVVTIILCIISKMVRIKLNVEAI